MIGRLSLKARLHIATVAMVLSLVFVLAGVNLHQTMVETFEDVQERADTNASQVRDFLLKVVNERAARRPQPKDFEKMKEVWTQILREDSLIPQLLQIALANSHLVADILVTNQDGLVLTASNIAHAGAYAPQLPDYSTWQKRPILERVIEIFSTNQDYANNIPLAAQGEGQELFTIRIIISAPLVREALWPEVENIGWITLSAIGLSVLYAFIFSNLMLRPLARVGDTIDRIAAGEFSTDPLKQPVESQEFADLQSKLGMIGAQVRGARQDALQLRGKIDQLLQRMEEVVLLFDESERLIMAGRPAERFFGQPREHLTGCSMRELFPDATPIGSTIRTAVQFRKPLTDMVIRHRMPSGDEENFLLSLDWNDDQILVTLRDAESRKALASHLDLSSRLASISRLTGGVAHEIKNPLNAIAINLEVLKTHLDPQNPELIGKVEVIAKEIARLDRVVKTFLYFTRPVEVKLTTLDLCEVTREIGQLVSAQAKRNSVDVNLRTPEPPIYAWADADLLKQAMLNMVVNAIEAMPKGGSLDLRLFREGNVASIEVEDRGTGIPEEVQDKIFQLYFTTKENGSGIGLAVAYQAVQLMGGTLGIRSQVGHGTLLRIGLPAVKVELDDEAETPAADADNGVKQESLPVTEKV